MPLVFKLLVCVKTNRQNLLDQLNSVNIQVPEDRKLQGMEYFLQDYVEDLRKIFINFNFHIEQLFLSELAPVNHRYENNEDITIMFLSEPLVLSGVNNNEMVASAKGNNHTIYLDRYILYLVPAKYPK